MRIPKHIGVIPDGNRRWAQNHGMTKDKGYEYGLLPGKQLVERAKTFGVDEITFYGFTVDNCKRPEVQREAFTKSCIDAVNIMKECDVSVRVVGNTQSKMFPQEMIPYTQKHKEGMAKVNILMNYSWQWDIGEKKAHLPNSGDIPRMELIMRWGGRNRLSGFLPIQSVYSDIYIVESLWPDFKEEELEAAIAWYDKQDITLGG